MSGDSKIFIFYFAEVIVWPRRTEKSSKMIRKERNWIRAKSSSVETNRGSVKKGEGENRVR